MLVRRKSSHGPTQLVPQFGLKPGRDRMHRAPKSSEVRTRRQAHRRVVERSRRRGLTGFLYQWKRDYCIVRETPDQHTTFPSSPQHVWDSPSFLVALPIHEKSPAQAPDFSQSGRVEPAAIDYSMICTMRCVRGSTRTVRLLTTV